MAAPTSGPCGPWITSADVLACCAGLADPPHEVQLQNAIDFATGVLFRLSGRQYPGLCSRTVRPCFGDGCGCGNPGWLQWPQGGWSYWVWDQAAAGWAFPSLPYRIDGEWWNMGSCCAGECALPSVLLPAPVASITEVVIDGEVLDPSAYAVEQHRRLVRLDGNDWPCTQDRRRSSGAYANDDPPSVNDGSRDGTWQITYSYGRVPDQSGLTAVSRFACEVAKFLCNADDCVLPQRLRTIVREGVSMDFADPLVFLDEGGRVGIYEVDLWLNSVNPGKLARRSAVRRLDAPPQYRGFT